MKSYLKFLHTLVVLLAAVTIFSLPVSAKTTRAAAYALSGYTGTETDVFTPDEGTGIRRLDMTAAWDFLGDAMHVKRYMQNGWCTAYAIIDTDECDGETVFTLEMADDLSAYSVLCIGIGVTSYSDPTPIRAELELSDYGGNRALFQTELPMPDDGVRETISWHMLYFDISEFEGRDDTASLTLTLTYDTEAAPSVFRITNPYTAEKDNGGFAYAEQYLTNSLKASAGVFGMKSGAARPDERGQVKLSGSFVLAEQPKIGSDAFLEIAVSRFSSGGLTVGIGYENQNGEVSYLNRITLSASDSMGTEVFTVPLAMTDRLQTLELNFDNMVCQTYFKIESIRLHDTDNVEITGNPDLGKVTSMTHSGNSVLFSGVMERDAVREYGDTELCFYAIPGWTSDDLDTAVEIGQMKVSTRFDYTADLSAYPYLADTYRFFAGLKTEDGKILPLSAPSYPDAADIPETAVSNVGLYDAASVGVFESNASHVIVDVPVDRLLTVLSQAESDGGTGDASTSLSYTIYSTVSDFRSAGVDGSINRAELPASGNYGEVNVISGQTKKTPVNHTLLRSLDSEINFYISAGIEVYLRLTSETCIPGLTYEEEGAAYYSVCPESPEARYFYTAIVRFLCHRYNGIGGLVVGKNVNDGQYTGGGVDDENAAVYARELAELCRITYNAASSEIADILIVLPFGEKSADETGTFRYVEPKTLTVMMASYLGKMGAVPWVMMYCTDDTESILSVDLLQSPETDVLDEDVRYSDSGSIARRTQQLTSELGLDGSAAILYFYEPSYEAVLLGLQNASDAEGESGVASYLAERFAKLCGSTRARAVFLSLDRLNDHLEHEFYAHLKNAEGITADGTNRRSVTDGLVVPETEMTDALTMTTGSFTLWDFTDKFYPLDWIAGGGVSSCATVYSDLFSDNMPDADRYARVLRLVISPDSNSGIPGSAAGISLRNLSRTIDFSGVDYLEFTFALNSPGLVMGTGNEGGTVVFVLGSDDCRAEFDVENAAYGQILTYVCDLSDYEYRDRVDYMGIMVYAENEVCLDLSSVKVYSNTLNPSELAEVFVPASEDNGPLVDLSAVALVSGIVFVLSITAAVMLIRHDVEERREMQIQKRLREERQRKRERIRR